VTNPVFRTLDDVEYGRVDQVSPLIRRVIAENPSKFTYRGTGTYIVGRGDVVVVDPGPRLESHRDALAAALAGERVVAILVTHCHSDHSPLAAWLHADTGAPTFAFGPHPPPDAEWEQLAVDEPEDTDEPDDIAESAASGPVQIEESTDFDFTPTVAVVDGEQIEVAGLTFTAVHTPGHTSNHTCWALGEERALFPGDHVMGWSTTVVSPPDGDMADYIESLRRVAGRADSVLWPTHGPPRDDAADYVSALVDHRLERERGVLAAVRNGLSSPRLIVELLYANVARELHRPARRSVWGHLIKLVDEGKIAVADGTRPGLQSTYVPV
jgi:glyoxylase-like metal-dependent hydrolase (beta-lactamase superfamily II)